jgi:hypothetical protein
MEPSAWPFPNPRVQVVREQYARARLFLDEAQASGDRTDRFRRLIAAVYPARAAVEIMLEAAQGQHLNAYLNADHKQSRNDLEAVIVPKLPRYFLLEKVRIHDFHRFGVLPQPGLLFQGPVKLMANAGTAGIEIPLSPGEGRTLFETGNSRVREQRRLQMLGEQVFDEAANSYMDLEQLLSDYLDALPPVIEHFEQLVTGRISRPAEIDSPE